MSVFRIVSDNGYPECNTCAFRESDVCDMCEDADQYEEGDFEDIARLVEERMAA